MVRSACVPYFMILLAVLGIDCSGRPGKPKTVSSDAADTTTSQDAAAEESSAAMPRPGAPGGTFTDPEHNLTVNALIPTYSATTIVSLSPEAQVLPMRMNHQTTQVDAAAFSDCVNCHSNLSSGGSYFPGLFHSSLANLKLASPSACSDCHSDTMPKGFVGSLATAPARSPASGEMKHDAVVWDNGTPGTTGIVGKECQVCHASPTQSADATWASGIAGATSVKFHASLEAATAPQPSSCVDCHANSRPNANLTAANATLPAAVSFDHAASTALGDCKSCHSKTNSWSAGKFHYPGSTTPATCVGCHQGQRPSSNAGWLSTTYAASPFDYGTNAQGITHGKGLDCVTCHAGPGTGAWGVNQNWIGGKFLHGAKSASATNCIACHSTQRPDLQSGATAAAVATLLGFDHSINGTGDCFGCHQATVTANTYVNYGAPGTGKLPGGDWKGGVSYPGATLISGMDQFVTLTEITLKRSGTLNLVTSTSSITATHYNSMLHTSTALPATLNPGPSGSPNTATCWHCHTNTKGLVTSYANGQYHSALSNFMAAVGGTVMPLPQPTSKCSECHTTMQPNNIVLRNAQTLIPMDHDALFKAPVTIAGVAVNGVAAMDCSTCHKSPGSVWNDGMFHQNIATAVPADCTSCHYPLMADKPKADVTSGTSFAMSHASTQMKFQSCQTCHVSAFANASQQVSETLWNPGELHSSMGTQPAACIDCHKVSQPKQATASNFAYAFTLGGSSSNSAQWMNHSSAQLGGRDCVACHAGDAKASGSAWNKAALFHAVVPKPGSCQECHGIGNGGGTVAGNNNNLPQGLSNSTTLTSASSNSTTGIAPGTFAQIAHTDVNVTGRDCNFCHTQVGRSSVAGVAGKEWAQAKFHANFTAATPLVMNATTGRCSNCHLNSKPGTSYTAQSHSSFSNVTGSTDCGSCHSFPGTGTPAAANWLGAKGGMPTFINVGAFAITQPPATTASVQKGIANLPHPSVAAGGSCTTCHGNSGGGKGALGYDHASTLINSNCSSCHEAGSDLLGTPWNKATVVSSGAGDTRPYTLTSVVANKGGSTLTVTYPKHFFPIDCGQCHRVPTGISTVKTGANYTAAWSFSHTTSKMTNPSTCVTCHTRGVPN